MTYIDVYKRLHAQCVEIVATIKVFRWQFEAMLPTSAIDAIARFVAYADTLDGRDGGT